MQNSYWHVMEQSLGIRLPLITTTISLKLLNTSKAVPILTTTPIRIEGQSVYQKRHTWAPLPPSFVIFHSL